MLATSFFSGSLVKQEFHRKFLISFKQRISTRNYLMSLLGQQQRQQQHYGNLFIILFILAIKLAICDNVSALARGVHLNGVLVKISQIEGDYL